MAGMKDRRRPPDTGRQERFGSRGLQLALVVLAATAGVYARYAVGPIQEGMRLGLALSDTQVALLQGPALALPLALAAVPLGRLVDRCSRVGLLLVFALVDVAGSLATGLAPDFLVLAAARSAVGLAASAISVTAYSLVADLFAPAQRGRMTMGVAIGEVAGSSAAFALGGMLLAVHGAAQQGWRWAMLGLTAPLVVIAAAMLGLREPSRTGAATIKASTVQALAELWRYRAVAAPLLAARMMVGMADGAALIWTTPTLSRRFALPPDRIGAIMAVGLLVSGLVGPIVGGVLADIGQRQGGPRRTMSILICVALLAAPMGLFAIMPDVVSLGLLLVAFMTLGFASSVAAISLSTVVIPNELRGLCLALSTAVGVIFGVGLAPMAVSLLASALGGAAAIGQALALVCVSASVLGAASLVLGRRYLPGG